MRHEVAIGGAVLGGLALLGAGPAQAAPTQPHELANPLVRADQCEYCHSYNNDPAAAAEPLYAPYFTWRGTMMANAARDPVFWAGVAIASQDALEPSETEACIRCHAPRAFLEGRGAAIAQDELRIEDLESVECELCHRMVEDGVPGNGNYAIDDVLAGTQVPRRGPWAYAGGEVPAPPHESLEDAFVGSSELCGTCHDVSTPRTRVDADGVSLGTPFNEQRTYREWAGSEFAVRGAGFASCQACHMPAVADMPGCRDNVAQYSHPTGGRRHDLLGANRFVIELLAAEASLLDSIAFNHSLTQLDAFVRTAATLEVEAPASVDLGDGLQDLRVTVTNESGHKLPTGYAEGRVMWLELVATYEDEVLWSSGAWDPDLQSFARDAQLRTYEAIAQQHDTGARFHVLLDDEWVEDTRIPPRGLRPDLETDPVTDRYVLQADGTWPSFDEHTYAFAGIPALAEVDGGELSVTVRLLYLVNTAEYVDFLADENATNMAGLELAAQFDAAGGAPPLVLAEHTVQVPIANVASGSSTGDASSTGVDATTQGAETTVSTDPSGTTGADGAAADEDGRGCNCRSSAGSSAGWLLGVLGGLSGLRRRRARRSA